MLLNGINIAFGITGCFQMFTYTLDCITKLKKEGAEVFPIMSYSAYLSNTKYGKAIEFRKSIESITGNKIIHKIKEAENCSKDHVINISVIAPCTGNTISKLANGISNTPVTIIAKQTLINGDSLVIGVSANDGLSFNAENIGKLLNAKNVYFIPFRQSNPITKPHRICFEENYIIDTILKAFNKEQIQPLLI